MMHLLLILVGVTLGIPLGMWIMSLICIEVEIKDYRETDKHRWDIV